MISRPSLNRVWRRIQVPTKWRGRATPEVKSFDSLIDFNLMEKVFLLCHPEREVVPGRRGRVPKPEV